MNALKKKAEQVKQKERRSKASSASKIEAFRSSEALSFWQNEIQELKGMEFSNIQEAMEAVACQVLKGIGKSGDDTESKNFLIQLLELDPEFQQRLLEGLHIRG
ncbi:MAG: hypothetical protein GYA55_06480 [SAR324 cluster bacterium]|uniref:Uncharacterized protein n=1 Tax=SAR324 cluster bacterium TaxID=2024889 RepID=A0A7X9FS34_9DELT|nr:hypothetical protein [SAR324 cluster bacterium]